MKSKTLLIPISLLNMIGSFAGKITDNPITFSFNPIGPYVEYNDDVTITGKLSTTQSYTAIRERISVGEEDEPYSYFYTTASHALNSRRVRNVSFTLPLSTMLSEDGIYGVIEVIDADNNVLVSKPFALRPAIPKTINVNNYLTRDYVVNDVIINITNYSIYHSESIKFTSFLDYFNTDTYYRLDLSQFKIKYSCFRPFPGGNATLHFVDYNNLFPNINNGQTIPEMDIPLTMSETSGYINFTFPETMYVNKKTLEMSLVARPDFLPTSYFYLPINKKDQLLDQVFSLRVNDFGYGKTSFNWNIRYLNSRGLLGDCSDSDYCVIGEVV